MNHWRSKTIQFKIAHAEDFNRTRLDLDGPNINLYDLVQGYCADLATVGDAKPHRAGAVMALCTDCKSETHLAEDKQRELNEVNRSKNAKMKADKAGRAAKNHAYAHLTCHTCGKLGQISPNCPVREEGTNGSAAGNSRGYLQL